jgi:hypothetical protein
MTGGLFPAFHCGGSSSILNQSMGDIVWTDWQWDKFLFDYICFSLSVSFHKCFIFILILVPLLPERDVGQAWDSLKKQWSFDCRGELK